MNVVDSPPGTMRPSRPSRCSGLRTSTTSAPRRRSIAACSRKLPWTARTPIRSGVSIVSILDTALQPIGQRPFSDLEEQRLELGAGGVKAFGDGDVVPAWFLPCLGTQ